MVCDIWCMLFGTQLICVRDMSHVYLGRALFVFEICLICIWDMTHLYMPTFILLTAASAMMCVCVYVCGCVYA